MHDSGADQGSKTIHPVFCIDPFLGGVTGKASANRMKFLLDTLEDLDASLRGMNSRLIVLQGDPCVELPKVCKEWGISRLAYEKDSEPYGIERDGKISEHAAKMGVEVLSEIGHTILDPWEMVEKAKGKPITTYQPFCNMWKETLRKAPVTLAPDVTSIPPLSPAALKQASGGELDVPQLAALGYKDADATSPFKGGEKEGLKRLRRYMLRTDWVAKFEKPKSAPTEVNPEERSTTVLSPYVTFGCLSSRVFWLELMDVYKRVNGKHSAPPVSLEGQLLWREFYYASALQTPNYDKVIGNPICRQIPWAEDEAAQSRFEAWRDARTGFPWIDACMTQLKQEGHVHHLARHALACFLTRGDCWVSWERGAAVFEEELLDFDFALNNGNWMWLSASCYFYQFFRCYSPVAFGKHTDPDGNFVKHYLPVLKNLPSKYVFEPWKAPLDVQKKAGCVVGKDYPERIVDHDVVSKQNMGMMKLAYDANKANAGAGAPASLPAKKKAAPSAKAAKAAVEGKSGAKAAGAKRLRGDGEEGGNKMKQGKLSFAQDVNN